MGENSPQKPKFEHFEGLAADMGKTGPSRLNLSILKAWPKI